ncbi:MAG TPA: amidohydrolase family protein [Candidatus Binataceae bacterium]|nr:amidohydrolase family protein [Candidatus Binataceae bacterium]
MKCSQISSQQPTLAPAPTERGRISRRQMLAGMAALGATALGAVGRARAQSAAAGTGAAQHGRIIDVHHHMLPPKYVKAVHQALSHETPPIPRVMNWTPAHSLEEMDRNGVATAVISVSTPGVWFDNVGQARRLARECNEYGAKLGQDHPGRFGLFAATPLPDTQGSLREIEYAMDSLHADGVGLLTNYDGKHLGDRKFWPVYEELNRRKAVVYVHPTSLAGCMTPVPGTTIALIEFPTDTTRTITDLIYSGTLTRYPNIQFIFSHGGGSMPMLAHRIFGGLEGQHRLKPSDQGFPPELRRLHYDTASITNPPAMTALLKMVPASQVLFGSDYPWGLIGPTERQLVGLNLTDDQVADIEYRNAHQLFTRFQAG